MRYLFTAFEHQIEIGIFKYLFENEDEGLHIGFMFVIFFLHLLVVIAPERNTRFIEIILESFFSLDMHCLYITVVSQYMENNKQQNRRESE